MQSQGYRLQFTSAKIEDLMYRTTFDPKKEEGDLVVNISVFKEEDAEAILNIFNKTMSSGLTVSSYVKLLESGDTISGYTIEENMIGIATVCSITVDGILLKSGILVKPQFGGLVQIKDGVPTRFTDVLRYESTTIDPLEVLMSQEVTSVSRMLRTGSGKILASLRGAPMIAKDDIESTLADMIDVGISGILEVGEPNSRVLDVNVQRDHFGIAVIGGTNPMAVVQENGYFISINAMSTLLDIDEMQLIDDII